MIYVCTGDKEKAKNWAKESFADYEFIFSYLDQFKLGEQQLQSGDDLFGIKSLYFIDQGVLDIFSENELKEAQGSHNIFIFFEDKLLKRHEKIMSDLVYEHKDFFKQSASKSFENIFELADFFGKKDKKNLWLCFEKYKRTKSAEEIAGVLMWQIKNIALVQSGDTKHGMKDFVYKKNVTYAGNFSRNEISTLSHNITNSIHNRDSYVSLMDSLEIILLSI